MCICAYTRQENKQYVTERQMDIASIRTQKDNVVDKIMNLGYSNETKHSEENRNRLQRKTAKPFNCIVFSYRKEPSPTSIYS